MVLEYAAGGELFDLIARRERVSTAFILIRRHFYSYMKTRAEKFFSRLFPVSNIHIRTK